jgi:hypothetical protein
VQPNATNVVRSLERCPVCVLRGHPHERRSLPRASARATPLCQGSKGIKRAHAAQVDLARAPSVPRDSRVPSDSTGGMLPVAELPQIIAADIRTYRVHS